MNARALFDSPRVSVVAGKLYDADHAEMVRAFNGERPTRRNVAVRTEEDAAVIYALARSVFGPCGGGR